MQDATPTPLAQPSIVWVECAPCALDVEVPWDDVAVDPVVASLVFSCPRCQRPQELPLDGARLELILTHGVRVVARDRTASAPSESISPRDVVPDGASEP